jgi:hypothetical protein
MSAFHVLDLPTEIASNIFIIALSVEAALDSHGFVSDTWHDLMNTRTGPWVFASVCTIWRDIILGLPFLWTNLRITFYASKLYIKEEILDMYLLGSGTLPLNLSIEIIGSNTISRPFNMFRPLNHTTRRDLILNDFKDKDLSSIRKLISTSKRWESLKFQGGCAFRSFLEMDGHDFSSLERLHLMFVSDRSTTETAWPHRTFDVFKTSFSLRHLSYYQQDISDFPRMTFPFAKLEYLATNALNRNHIQDASTSAITSLSLGGIVRIDKDTQFPHVRSLTLTQGAFVFFQSNIMRIRFSSLQEIIFDDTEELEAGTGFEEIATRPDWITNVKRVVCVQDIGVPVFDQYRHALCKLSRLAWMMFSSLLFKSW